MYNAVTSNHWPKHTISSTESRPINIYDLIPAITLQSAFPPVAMGMRKERGIPGQLAGAVAEVREISLGRKT